MLNILSRYAFLHLESLAYFEYFKRVEWMLDPNSNYYLRTHGKIEVKTDGMYQIIGHVGFHIYIITTSLLS